MRSLGSRKYFEPVLLLALAAITYLPYIGQLGYYKDDWYIIYGAHSQGAAFLNDVFASDRPARGVLMSALYPVFGDHAVYYNLSAFVVRFLGALALLWLLRLIWPRQRMPALVVAASFLVYPGYLSWPNGIDFQSHVVSMLLAILSIGLSVRSITSKNPVLSVVAFALSAVLGWAYLGLVEYSIGFEVLRLALLYLVLRDADAAWQRNARLLLRRGWYVLIIPLAFVFWQVFVFQTQRRATNVGAQFGQLFGSPLFTGLWWSIYFVEGLLNVVLLAWAVPLSQIAFVARLRDVLIGFGLAAVTAAALYVILGRERQDKSQQDTEREWQWEYAAVGLLAVVASLIPVIVANRHIDFAEFSRYALPGSVGAAILITAFLYGVRAPRWRWTIMCLLLFSAIATHLTNAARYVEQGRSVRAFWWQVAWRAPQIAPGTTLAVHYAESGVPEDYVVWGPANLIYHPEAHAERPVQPVLSAIILSPEDIARVRSAANGQLSPGRATVSSVEYKNLLVMSQPSAQACVRVYHGSEAVFSINEDEAVILVAPFSRIENVLPGTSGATPPEAIFGPEPERDWCFYFEKAELARQQKNWDEIARLGNEALKQELHANDQIEWLPFLQAYAHIGDAKQVRDISKRINAQAYYRRETCNALTGTPEAQALLSPGMQALIRDLFCSGQ